ADVRQLLRGEDLPVAVVQRERDDLVPGPRTGLEEIEGGRDRRRHPDEGDVRLGRIRVADDEPRAVLLHERAAERAEPVRAAESAAPNAVCKLAVRPATTLRAGPEPAIPARPGRCDVEDMPPAVDAHSRDATRLPGQRIERPTCHPCDHVLPSEL